MSRISYEGNTTVIMQEGLPRQGFYYYEARYCTQDTENTISTIIQKNIMARTNLEGRLYDTT